MRLTAKSSLADVAVIAGDALRRAGIRAVLTGGACAALYSGGAHQSLDADFVLGSPQSTQDLDRALAVIGFKRTRDYYVHPVVPFFVEFPKGPLGIGEDYRIRPVWRRQRSARFLILSPTDSCRDRLAAFYHWSDRQALSSAVAIAGGNRVAFRKLRDWSRREGHLKDYGTFLIGLRETRRGERHVIRPRRGK